MYWAIVKKTRANSEKKCQKFRCPSMLSDNILFVKKNSYYFIPAGIAFPT